MCLAVTCGTLRVRPDARTEFPGGRGGPPATTSDRRAAGSSPRPKSERWPTVKVVELRIGALAWGRWPAPRFPSPLIELDMPIFGIQLSDSSSGDGGAP